jgi:membrane-associated PAP2 superfamily phosphatase
MRLPPVVDLRSLRETGLTVDFYVRHAMAPALALLAVVLAFQLWSIDTRIAELWAFDSLHQRWLGHGHWWAEELLHHDGRDAILLLIGGLLGTLGAGVLVPRLQAVRSTALYLLVSIALAWGLVGLLKHVTNVPCPWSIAGFGGLRPHVGLFDPRPSGYAPAACFPGAHSASGFALFAFYFAWRERRPQRARWAFAIALLIGALFAFGQEARGAHFLSHDLCSAFVSWFVTLATYLGWRRLRAGRLLKMRSPAPGETPTGPPRTGSPARSGAPACARSATSRPCRT